MLGLIAAPDGIQGVLRRGFEVRHLGFRRIVVSEIARPSYFEGLCKFQSKATVLPVQLWIMGTKLVLSIVLNLVEAGMKWSGGAKRQHGGTLPGGRRAHPAAVRGRLDVTRERRGLHPAVQRGQPEPAPLATGGAVIFTAPCSFCAATRGGNTPGENDAAVRG